MDDDMDLNAHDLQLPDTTDKRELIYRIKMAKLLVGDLTGEAVRQQADQLLRSLAKQSPPGAVSLLNHKNLIVAAVQTNANGPMEFKAVSYIRGLPFWGSGC